MAKKKSRQRDPEESSDSGAAHETATVASGCCHIPKAVDLACLRKKMKSGLSLECHTCSKSGSSSSVPGVNNGDGDIDTTVSLWLCLKCGNIGCGRSQAKHALDHFSSPRSDIHAMVVDIDSWTVWCYNCEQEMGFKATKKLQECVDYVRRHLQSSAGVQSVSTAPNNDRPALNEAVTGINVEAAAGAAVQGKSVAKDFISKKQKSHRVRGLINLGNTCFYNSVLQCLSVTPFLTSVLQRLTEMGENFTLPGDSNSKDVELPPVEGELGESGVMTKSLLSLLTDMRSSSNSADTLRPSQLLKNVQDRYPLFQGHEQHDAHELLRHLLEGVRSDDLKRYQHVLLKKNGLSRSSNPEHVAQDIKKKMKLYGLQLQELTLGVEGIFKGQLVSILACQDCRHLSVRSENFLDLSLPVAEDKPLPPMRKKDNADSVGNDVTSKYQLKKQKKEAKRKVQRSRRVKSGSPDRSLTILEENTNGQDGDASEQSDADVEDNIEQDSLPNLNGKEVEESGYSSEKHLTGESEQTSPSITNTEVEKDQNFSVSHVENSSWEEYYTPTHARHNDKVLIGPVADDNTQSQFHTPEHPCVNGHCSLKVETERSCDTPEDEQLSITIPEGIGELSMHMSPVEPSPSDRPISRCGFVHEGQIEKFLHDSKSVSVSDLETQLQTLHVDGEKGCASKEDIFEDQADGHRDMNAHNSKAIESHSQSEPQIDQKDILSWCKTLAPKQQTEDGECSVVSCLNQFTSMELMTGNNKVGCDACTRRLNKGKEGKTVYTNSTKQLLISSPPAVLILHLKRFMMENFRFRKLQRYVGFPLELDIAPFCSSKCKDLPSMSADQTEVKYSLFGVVEHTGSLNTGHYVAYIKIRSALGESDPRWSFLPQNRNFVYPKSDNPQKSPDGGIDEKWYSISDSRVVETNEAKILKTQAYLLFYERLV